MPSLRDWICWYTAPFRPGFSSHADTYSGFLCTTWDMLHSCLDGQSNGRFTYLLVAGGGLHLHNPRARGNSILPQRDWTRQMHDIVSHCVQDQFDYGVESEFLHYVISVGFCRLHGYPQDCCHVLGSAALPDHLDDLSLAWRQSRLHCSSFIVLPLTQAAV